MAIINIEQIAPNTYKVSPPHIEPATVIVSAYSKQCDCEEYCNTREKGIGCKHTTFFFMYADYYLKKRNG